MIKSVLLVDDEQQFLSSLREGLVNSGRPCEVLTAHNGKEALDVLRSKQIHLVVTDLKMPEMDGLQLLASMSKEFPAIPTIAMTAYGTPTLEERLTPFGIKKYVEKPVDFGELSQLIFDGLELTQASFEGFSLPSFVQLLEAERKTGRLRVKLKDSGGVIGFLTFVTGKLVHAEMGELLGTEAALEILAWGDVAIQLDEGRFPDEEHTIDSPLQHLLMEAMVLRDERARGENEDSEEDEPVEGLDAPGDSGGQEEAGANKEQNPTDRSERGRAEEEKMSEGRTTQVGAVLSEMRTNVAGVEGMGLISAEGLVIQVEIPPEWTDKGMDEDHISAMVSGLVGIAETSTARFKKDDFHRVTVKSSDGYFAAIKVNEDCYLFTITNTKAKLGMLYLGMEEAAKQLAPAMTM